MALSLSGGIQSGSDTPALFYLYAPDANFTFETSALKGEYTYSKSATFNQNDILGRSSPIITYSKSEAIILNVSVQLIAYDTGAREEVTDVIQSLVALTFPVEEGVKPPPLCQVTIGEFKDWECVVNNVAVTAGENNIWDERGMPYMASVDLTFLGVEIQGKTAKDYMKAKDYKRLAF